MPSPERLTLAIVSDIHAYDVLNGDEHKPSHLCISDPAEPSTHPMAGLTTLITKSTPPLRADYLCCLGDMGNRAKPEAIRYAWGALDKARKALKASAVLATAGNHDVDSRYIYNDHDAKGVLQMLVPGFPLKQERLSNQYWARHFTIITNSNYRIVLLNSSAYHGAGDATGTRQYEHGRISTNTLKDLCTRLKAIAPAPPVNVLLCHHHPVRQPGFPLPDYQEMRGGAELVETLASREYGHWLVIHGHRHLPKVWYAPASGSSSPVVFSAGSLCAHLFGELQTLTHNQFYMLEMSFAACRAYGLVGKFRAWDWAYGMGWQEAGTKSGLPAYGGFGYKHSGTALARRVSGVITQPYMKWNELCCHLPELEYLTPADHAQLAEDLRTVCGKTLAVSEGRILEVGGGR